MACEEEYRGLRQKPDALRVQTGQSLLKYHGFIRKLVCYKGISFFKFIWTPDFSCVQNEPCEATSSIFNPFWLHLLFFMNLLICFELSGPEIEKLYKWTLKRLKLGMVSSFHPHSMCKKVERVTAKTGRTSCTNWTNSFGVWGFRTRTHLLHGQFNVFYTYLNSILFLRSVCIIQSDVINFQHVLTSFAVFLSFTDCLES